jgi:hypothetical protein
MKSSIKKIKKMKAKDGKTMKVAKPAPDAKAPSKKEAKPAATKPKKEKVAKPAKAKKEKPAKTEKTSLKASKTEKTSLKKDKAFVAPVFKNKKESGIYLTEALKKSPKIVSVWLEHNKSKLGKVPFVPAKVKIESKDTFVEALFGEKFAEFSAKFKVSSLGNKELNKEASTDARTSNLLALSAFLA